MILAQISEKSSLRDTAGQFGAQVSKLDHLGVKRTCRSTLSDANNHRPAESLDALFGLLYAKWGACAPPKRVRFKIKLYSFHSTTIEPCLALIPLGGIPAIQRRHQAACPPGPRWPRFRLRLDDRRQNQGHRPGHAAEITPLPIVTLDCGCFDSSWFSELTAGKILFVTRMKRNVPYRIEQRRPVFLHKGLSCNQTIVLHASINEQKPARLRRIGYRDPENIMCSLPTSFTWRQQISPGFLQITGKWRFFQFNQTMS